MADTEPAWTPRKKLVFLPQAAVIIALMSWLAVAHLNLFPLASVGIGAIIIAGAVLLKALNELW